MGKRWRKYSVGIYRLGQLHGEAVVVWSDSEGPHRRRLGVHGEVEGKQAVDNFVRKLRQLRADDPKTVSEVWTDYIADRQRDGKKVKAMQYHWRALAPRFAAMTTQSINADVCRDYAKGRLEAGRSQGTIWTELTQLRSALNWAKKRRFITEAPYVWIPAKPKPKQRVLTQDEIYRLLEADAMPHIRLFIALALKTGGRTEALLELTWDRVDFAAGTIDLNEPATINPLTKAVRKGRSVVPIADDLLPFLRDATAGALSNHVIEWCGEPVQRVAKSFARTRGLAGLGPEVTPHTLRHTVASLATDAGVPMLKISRLLGHRDSKTSERIYGKSSPGFAADAQNVVRLTKAPKSGGGR
jgi:integrase